jgi:carbon-monoxide dehydrogenase small subunit
MRAATAGTDYMNELTRINLTVNGEFHEISVRGESTLLETLRNQLQLTGAKSGCNMGSCGACTVIVDGDAVRACLVLSASLNDRHVQTIEGLQNKDGSLHPLQHAFLVKHGTQCGFCTPGMIMAAHALIEHSPNPSEEQVVEALSGQLCRCTGYSKIVEAVLSVNQVNSNE